MGTVLAVVLGIVMLTGAMVVVPDGTDALPADAWITGVVDDGTNPVADVYIKVMLFTAGGMDIGYAFTDASGEYTIGLPGGFEYMIIAANESYYMALTMVEVDVGETAWVNFSLEPIFPALTSVTIKGFVMDEYGSPALGGHVLGISNDPMVENFPMYANVTTPDVTGYFEVNVIESSVGGGAVAFDNPGYPMVDNTTESSIVSGGTYWFNITLTSTSSMDDAMIHGQVTDASTGLGIEGVLVSVEIWSESLGTGYSNYTFTDSDGNYEMGVTSGEMDVWITKGGYTMAMFEDEAIAPGADLQFDAALMQLNCVVRGNVTDLKSGLPIQMARVLVMDSEGNMAMATTNETGFYELDAFDGADLYLVAQADGYSQNYTIVTLSPSDEVWYDFGLFPATAAVEGYVTDAVTGAFIEGAWVSANLAEGGFSDDTQTDASGYYQLMLVPGHYEIWANAMDYMQAGDEVDAVDEDTVVVSFALVPWDVEESCFVHGFVTDSDSGDPIINARVGIAFADLSYQNYTQTDDAGLYEMYVAPIDGMMIGATAYMHGPYFGTLDCFGTADLMLNMQLDPDPYAPNLTYSQSPVENVSWTNPMTIDAEVEDPYLRQMLMLNFMPWYTNSTHEVLYMVEGTSVSFDPFSPSSGLEYALDGDNYTVHDELNGTIDDASILGGWVGDGSSDPSYLAVYKQWWGSELLYGVRAYYSNDTLSDMPGGAYFDSDTGEYMLFHFDWGMEEAYPDDTSGVVELMVNQMSISLADPADWMTQWEIPLQQYGVVGLTFTPDPRAPSGGWATVFGYDDFGYQGMWLVTKYTVDNEEPVAYPGPDQSVVVDTVCTLDGSGTTDNVGIANYTWEFEDDGVTVYRYAESFDYTFTAVGDHIVTLTVMDGAGHVSAAACTVEVLADAAPVASAGPDQEVDEDTLVTFDGAGSSDDLGVVNWTWTITPTSAVMYGESPEYTFSEPGVYTVELVVTDTVGQESEIDTMTVTVLDVTDPTADAGADQEVSFGEEVTFDGSDSSDNVDIASYEWTFDDVGPETLTGATPAYTFTAPGDYTVTLTVADSAGNEDSDTMVVTVVDDEAPVADAGPDPTDVVIGDLVSFDAAASADNVGIANYTWNFTDGDEVFLYGDTVSYLFENAGEFVVTLTVTDAAGLSDTDTVVVRVSEELNEAPDADAGDDIEASEGDAVTFDGSGSSDDVEVESYTWTFEYDDEVQTLTGVSPEFVFEVPGTYVVTLNVTDAEGEWDTDTVVVIVEEKASTFFTEYWWVLAAVAAIVVIAVLALLMRGGKASAASTKPEDEGDELEEEELPPPDDEDV